MMRVMITKESKVLENSSFANFGKFIYDKLFKSKFDEHIYNSITKPLTDKQAQNISEKWLTETFGSEVFFNDLTAYLHENYTISRLLEVAHGEHSFEANNSTSFALIHYQSFTKKYPQYSDVSLKDKLQNAFDGLFSLIFQYINKIDPNSDIGKLQRTIQSYADKQTAILLNAIENPNCNSIGRFNSTQESTENGTNSFAEDLIDTTEIVSEYLNNVQTIEKDYQEKHLFLDAIQRYQTMLTEIFYFPNTSDEFVKLSSALYCNIALCYSNIGDYESAKKYIKLIPDKFSIKNPKYHFIQAAIIVNAEDIGHYIDAIQYAERALELNPKYHKALCLAKYIRITLQPSLLPSILLEYDEYFKDIISSEEKSEILFEYYSNRGLIQLIGGNSNNALEDLEIASKYGDDMVLQFNIASALYCNVLKSLPKNIRIIPPELPQAPLLQAYNISKKLLFSDEWNKNKHGHTLSLYISVCFLLRISHGLSIEDYLSELDTIEPETVRIFLLGCDNIPEELSEKFFSETDRCFIKASNYFNSENFTNCKAYIEELIRGGKPVDSSIYLTLLQTCIAIPDLINYWEYRKHSHEYGLSGLYITSLDAFAYELEGRIDEATALIDDLVLKTTDYNILMNIIRYYGRNGYQDKQHKLYSEIYTKWSIHELCINDISGFIMSYITFLTVNNSTLAIDILHSLPSDILPQKLYNELYINYYLRINAPQQSLPHVECLYDVCKDTSSGILLAQTLKKLFRYGEAIVLCESLLTFASTDIEKNEILWLLSDLCFLTGDKDSSYRWAVQARDIVNHFPEHPSHQIFLTRSLICDHMEGLTTIIDYKNKHPVVVDYLNEYSFDTKSPTAGEDFLAILSSLSGNTEEKQNQKKQLINYYKNKIFPTNFIIQYFSDDWFDLFLFAQDNKLNIDLGDAGVLYHDIETINEKIIIDAQTLIIMKLFNCLEALNYVDTVYINTGSVDYLQHVCFSFKNSFVVEVLQYIEDSNNIIIIPDGFLVETSNKDIFGLNFVSCCTLSKNLNAPFLYHDTLPKILQTNTTQVDPKIKFISIRAICGYAKQKAGDIAEQWYYNLLKGCSFISFSSETILYQIRLKNYEIDDELMQPFLICKSDYDMDSFASVYFITIQNLIPEHPETAEKLAIIIINDTIRVWKRGQYHRLHSTNYTEHQEKAIQIYRYANTLKNKISKMFSNPSECLQEKLTSLSISLEDLLH